MAGDPAPPGRPASPGVVPVRPVSPVSAVSAYAAADWGDRLPLLSSLSRGAIRTDAC